MAIARVLCVDDNQWIGDSIERFVRAQAGWEWLGWRSSAAELERIAPTLGRAIVLLDIDLPGEDSLAVAARVIRSCPEVRVIILSGHLSAELVDRALDAGAWGYLSKTDDTEVLLRAIERVAGGEVALSPAVLEGFERGSLR